MANQLSSVLYIQILDIIIQSQFALFLTNCHFNCDCEAVSKYLIPCCLA